MIQAVIFDMGGVLAQDVWEHMFLDPEVGFANRFGLNAAELNKIGLLLWESFAYIPEIPPNGWRELEFRYWKQFLNFYGERIPQSVRDSGPQFWIEETERFVVPVPGVEAELERLQDRGIALAMCSDNNEFWFRRQMDKCSLHRFFSPDKVALSCRVGVSKGSPRLEMFHAAMRTLGAAASNCLFIDDRQNNVDRAKAAGMDALLFTSAEKLGSELLQRGL